MNNNIFLDRLNSILKNRNMNRKELSQISNIKYSTIDTWYNRSADNIKLSTLLKLTNALNCSLDYLVGNSNIESIVDIDNFIDVNKDEKEILNKFRNLDERGQKNINRMLDMELENKEE